MERKSEISLSTNLNDPPGEAPVVDCLYCNLRLVCPLMEREISFLITKSRFRFVKRNAILVLITSYTVMITEGHLNQFRPTANFSQLQFS